MAREDHIETNTRMDDLIRRVRMLLHSPDLCDHFVREGFTPEEVWLALCAAEILENDNRPGV